MAVSTRGALVAMMLIFAVLLTAHTSEAMWRDCSGRCVDDCLNKLHRSKPYCYGGCYGSCLLIPGKQQEEQKLRSPKLEAPLDSSSKH